MSDAEEEDPNQLQRSGNGNGQIRLEDLEPGALSPSRASAGRARVPHLHLADEAVTARSSGGGASSREGKMFGPFISFAARDKARNKIFSFF